MVAASSSGEPLRSQTADEPTVLKDLPLTMPDEARTRGVSLVVVEARLDASGVVIDAHALSGAKHSVVDALKNVKEWRFSREGSRRVIVVYKFVALPYRRLTGVGVGTYARSGTTVTVTDARMEPTP
jgi:hypothetical protein